MYAYLQRRRDTTCCGEDKERRQKPTCNNEKLTASVVHTTCSLKAGGSFGCGDSNRNAPAVVLGAELEVAHDDADLSAGDGEDEHDGHQEPEDVVQLLLPHGRHHEHQLHQHGSEGEHPGEGHGHLKDTRGRQ